jgi:hypothetical protein
MNIVVKFEELGRLVASKHPTWSHNRRETTAGTRFEYPKLNENGFSVSIIVGDKSVDIETDCGWHTHYHEPSDDERAGLTGLVRDMLSNSMRIRELRAGGGPYRWHLEVLDRTNWIADGTIGLLFWNYFGSRTEAIYQNEHLPPREDVMKSDRKDPT